ncbi:hypothetical protein LSAT2_016012, partial [Lamellibrachia satsuma]
MTSSRQRPAQARHAPAAQRVVAADHQRRQADDGARWWSARVSAGRRVGDPFSFREAITDKLNSSITASYWRVSRDIGAKLNVVNENTDGVVVFADSTLTKHLLHLGQLRELMTASWTWFFVVESAAEWEDALKPGDRVILIELNAHAAKNAVQCDKPKNATGRCFHLFAFIDRSILSHNIMATDESAEKRKWTKSSTPEKSTQARKYAASVVPQKRLADDMRTNVTVQYPVWIMSLGKEVLEQVGTWDAKGRNTRSAFGKNLWRFDGFANKRFRVVTIELSTFHFKHNVNGTTVWKGICFEILNVLAKTLNFSYDVVETDQWGSREVDGSWNGAVGMVAREVIDFAVAKFTVTEQRAKVIDYSYPFWQEPSAMIMRRPHRDYLTVYIGPFHADVWLVLSLSLPLVGLALAAIIYLESAVVGSERVDVTKTVMETMWVVFHMYFQQGRHQLKTSCR